MAETRAHNDGQQLNWTLIGKTAIVTGANSGLGRATAMRLAKAGAKHLILACRNADAGNVVAAEIRQKVGAACTVSCWQLDLASFQSIRRFVGDFTRTREPLHLLVCNAGVWSDNKRRTTADGHELTFQTNHLGHFLLCRLLLDTMRRWAPARIIVVSSKGYAYCWPTGCNIEDPNFERGSYSAMKAYCHSKLANILFARELHRYLNMDTFSGIAVFATYPGAVKTKLTRNMHPVKRILLKPFAALFFKNPDQGSSTPFYCASEPGLEKFSGHYFADKKIAQLLSIATDDVAAQRLWELSERLTGLA